ncbi:Glu/Leu/Phe/Val dehydrogenase dimerization domain-containing protein [Inmirania thermothiophila]|uniref:Leucine dehydrogenase n=1 Tax=Inmirania thermothiophila TaxID=1750597 RepID=A0A3N1Y1T8_9GAMM|nr:Glu/Leu/Phe/Val dehydrogenase dimerization domain-containing protein [Inmirania thermothiophila]ROR32786.1 leucine dehydrogenase [Inmirania thermothiophila]
MRPFQSMEEGGHEALHLFRDGGCGLRAVIAIHSTLLGPALGGVRMWPYPDESAAVEDALRLARAMTFKAALAGLDFGGGKAVILGEPHRDRSEALMRAFGRCVESLGGRYIAAEDVGTGPEDMAWIAAETRHVTGLPPERGGSGDPSPVTALGVLHGIRACLRHRLGHERVGLVRYALQGLGHVGWALAHLLRAEGATVVATDLDRARLERATAELGVIPAEPDEILDTDAEVFVPCALGGVLDEAAAGRLRAVIVAGSANNPLADDAVAELLARRGILYAPDYAINAGGLIHVAVALAGGRPEHARARAAAIGDTLDRIFRLAAREGITPLAAAHRLAAARLEAIARIAPRRPPVAA